MNKELRTGIPLIDDLVDDVVDTAKDLIPKPRGQKAKPAGQAGGRRGGQAAGQKTAPGPDKRWTVVDIHLVATALVLAGAVALRWVDMSVCAWTLSGGWAAYLAVAGYVALTLRGRRAEVEQIVSLSVRGLKADPRFIRAGRHRWRFRRGLLTDAYRGRVWFPDHAILRSRAAQQQVEVEFGTAFSARLTWPTTAKRPYFDWEEVDEPPGPGPESMPEEPPATEAREKVRSTIEDDLRRTMKLKADQPLTFKITDLDGEGPRKCLMRYPPGFPDHSPDARYLVQHRVSKQLGGLRFVADWDQRAEKKTLTLTRRPPMPREVPFRFPAPGEVLDPKFIPIGVDEKQGEQGWDLRAHPHMIFAGATGAGKSITLAELIYQLLIRGWQLILIDGKGTTFAPFRRWPGVVGYGLANDPESMAHWMEQGKYITEDRYDQVINNDADPAQFPPLAIIIDELTEANETVADWWKLLRGQDPKLPRDCPAIGAWASVARKGREGGVHLLVATQQPNASDNTFGSTETKANLAGRFFLGPTEQQSSLMMFGRSDVGRDIPAKAKGRGTLLVPSEDEETEVRTVEVQTYLTPRPLPSGKILDRDREFFAELMPLVEAAQSKVKRVAPSGGSIDARPDPRLRDIEPTRPAVQRTLPIPVGGPRLLDVFELADMLRDEEEVWVYLDGELLKVIEVIGDEDAEITHLNADGKPETLVVDDSARFELRGES